MLTGTTVLSFIAVVCPCGYFALLICHKSVVSNVVSFSAPLYYLQRFLAVLVDVTWVIAVWNMSLDV
jgi:hypothetical protein